MAWRLAAAVLLCGVGLAACGGGGGAGGAGADTPAGPPKASGKLAACTVDACAELSKCPLTEKDSLEAFVCRPCTQEAAAGCADAKDCSVKDAAALEALLCRAIEQKMSCKDAQDKARAGWKKEGEPPFLDDTTLSYAVEHKYWRHAAPELRCNPGAM
jgi:hypothetical protein